MSIFYVSLFMDSPYCSTDLLGYHIPEKYKHLSRKKALALHNLNTIYYSEVLPHHFFQATMSHPFMPLPPPAPLHGYPADHK